MARISVMPGRARALNYLCSMAVDEGHGVISHVQADFADQRDCTPLLSIVAPATGFVERAAMGQAALA
jgi:hypothetical protein